MDKTIVTTEQIIADATRKTLRYVLAEQREQIASEIEQVIFFDATGKTPEYAAKNIQARCAAIARGQK